MFGQDFDQGLGEGTHINTVYSTTRPKGTNSKTTKDGKQHLNTLPPLKSLKNILKGPNPPIPGFAHGYFFTFFETF